MRTGVVPHAIRLDEANVHLLREFDFIFVCVDKGSVRRVVLNSLKAHDIPFVDVGMGVEVTPDQKLLAVCRTTAGTSGRSAHIESRVPLADMDGDDAYTQNIQIAELNALNAAFAVIKWKKIVGVYEDADQEHHSTYSTNFQLEVCTVNPTFRRDHSGDGRAWRSLRFDEPGERDSPMCLRVRAGSHYSVVPYGLEALFRWGECQPRAVDRKLGLSLPLSLLDP